MGVRELTAGEIAGLVGERHAGTGIAYPAEGLQPYYAWLVRTLHLLAESSCGAFRVVRDADVATGVRVLPGRATIDDVAVSYAGGALDLAGWNNTTAHVWLTEDAGAAVVEAGDAAAGWPAAKHVKLATVTLAGGAVTDVTDLRFEAVFRV